MSSHAPGGSPWRRRGCHGACPGCIPTRGDSYCKCEGATATVQGPGSVFQWWGTLYHVATGEAGAACSIGRRSSVAAVFHPFTSMGKSSASQHVLLLWCRPQGVPCSLGCEVGEMISYHLVNVPNGGWMDLLSVHQRQRGEAYIKIFAFFIPSVHGAHRGEQWHFARSFFSNKRNISIHYNERRKSFHVVCYFSTFSCWMYVWKG